MPAWLKVLLALVAMGLFGVAVLVGGAVWWVRKNGDKVMEDARAATAEGKAFGRTRGQGECIEDGFARVKSCGETGFLCETNVKMRLAACLSVAEDDGACKKSVPGAMGAFKDALAGNAECARRGQAGSQACARLVQGFGVACAQANGAQ